MKKVNLAVIATIMATFVISMCAFQPTATAEASNYVLPVATPSPRKIRKLPRQSTEVENDETHRTRKPITKVKTKKPAYKEGGVNDTTHRTQKQKVKPRKPAGFQELSGIGMEATLRKNSNQVQAQYNPKELGIKNGVTRKSSKNKVSGKTVKPTKRKN